MILPFFRRGLSSLWPLALKTIRKIRPYTTLELMFYERFIILERLSLLKILDEKTSGYILACKFCATRSHNGFDGLN